MKWTVKSSVARYQAALIGYALLIVLCGITLYFGKAPTVLLKGVLLVSCLWACSQIVLCVSRINKPVEMIVVDRQCLVDHTSWLSLKEIPWYMVDEVKVMAYGKQTVICLYGSELKELVRKKDPVSQIVIHIKHILGYGYHMIKPLYADVDLEQLVNIIKRKGK